jgi:hypothetical protein
MTSSHYIGKAGQIAVMAELAWRGYNVSIPEIDVGDDVFALNDSNAKLFRIQVKTATGIKLTRTDAYRCKFRINRDHLNSRNSGTHYVLVGRHGGNWRFLIFKRFVLARLLKAGLGTKMKKGWHMVTVIFSGRHKAHSSTKKTAFDLSKHAWRWSLWPKLPGGADSN